MLYLAIVTSPPFSVVNGPLLFQFSVPTWLLRPSPASSSVKERERVREREQEGEGERKETTDGRTLRVCATLRLEYILTELAAQKENFHNVDRHSFSSAKTLSARRRYCAGSVRYRGYFDFASTLGRRLPSTPPFLFYFFFFFHDGGIELTRKVWSLLSEPPFRAGGLIYYRGARSCEKKLPSTPRNRVAGWCLRSITSTPFAKVSHLKSDQACCSPKRTRRRSNNRPPAHYYCWC